MYQQIFFALLSPLAFLLAGVPLAILLDKLGFFQAAADALLQRRPSLFKLWLLAAATTIVLNLDTTIVLLTPLYIHIAKKTKNDPLPFAVIPLLLASFASSFLPISNLTNLIAANALHISVTEFVLHLGLPTIIAISTGWFFYKLRFPRKLHIPHLKEKPNKTVLLIGGSIIFMLLLAFTLGPAVGIQPWMAALGADILLILITRSFPWRSIPLQTACGVLLVASIVITLLPVGVLKPIFQSQDSLFQMIASASLAVLGANTINNLPTTFIVINNNTSANWSVWAWLIGVNVGAVLVPIGALANILWSGIAKHNKMNISLRRYIAITFPIGIPTLIITCLVLVLEYVLLQK